MLALVVLGFRWLEHQSERDDALRGAKSGDFDSVRPALDRCLERQPNDVELLRAYALAALKAGRLPESEIAFDRWCSVDSSNPEPFLARIDLRLAQKQLPQAIEDAGVALRLRPDDDELRLKRAQWLYTTGELDEANRECGECLQRHADDLNVVQLQAEICYALGETLRTQELVGKLLFRDPNRPAALVLRGALYIDAGQPERAIPLMQQVLAMRREKQRAASHYLSLALSQTGQLEEAKRVIAELQQNQTLTLWQQYGHTDHKLGLQVRIAESLLNTGRSDEGLRMLEEILRETPDCTSAHKLLADFYQQQGQVEKAAFHRLRARP